MITLIQKEFYLHRTLFAVLVLTVLSSYSVYLLGETVVNQVGQEDGIFEYLTALFFFLAALTLGWTFFRTKRIFFLLLAIVLFVGCGKKLVGASGFLGLAPPIISKQPMCKARPHCTTLKY